MFTAAQLQAAHSKVQSGADFPAYIRSIKEMGVSHYACYVTDGHIDYHGANGHRAIVPAKYESLRIAETVDTQAFTTGLKAHQKGKSDFMEFIRMCAETGIEKWEVRMEEMTCTYFDRSGNQLLVEAIPE